MLVKQKDIDLNKKNKYGKTPLAYAQDQRAIDIVKLLIKNGADVNEEYNGNIETILSWALSVNDPEITPLVIEKSNPDNLNKKNGNIGFPLFWVISNISSTDPIERNRFIEIAKLFINKEGVNLNITNDNGYTPLHWTILRASDVKSLEIKKEFIEIAKLLINKEGVNLNITNDNGNTPISIAQGHNFTDIITLLKEKGAKQ